MRVHVIDIDHKGNGIGKIDNKVIFIPKSVPGDICNVDIYKSYKKYDIGRIKEITTNSLDRIGAKCPYYDICGGCNISNFNYSKQLEFKKNKIKNIFDKYLGIKLNPYIIPSINEYAYRNKITYHVNNNIIGLVGEDGNLVDIDKCLLVSDRINSLYTSLRNEDLSNVNLITIKECDNGIILCIDGDINIESFKDKCISIYINNKCVYYKEDGYIKINDIKYLISDRSFFQVNTSNVSHLYDEIVRVAQFNKSDNVIDLYCGVGSISLYIAKYVNSALGIEIVDKAIEDANKNALINEIRNVKFVCEDVSKLNLEVMEADILIVDPPRTGLDNRTKKILNQKKLKKIIYVSCDPMTLVRDLKDLDNYILEDIILVDMFPQTHHVECVVKLCQK